MTKHSSEELWKIGSETNKMALQQSIHFVKFNQTGQLKTDNFGSAAV